MFVYNEAKRDKTPYDTKSRIKNTTMGSTDTPILTR